MVNIRNLSRLRCRTATGMEGRSSMDMNRDSSMDSKHTVMEDMNKSRDMISEGNTTEDTVKVTMSHSNDNQSSPMDTVSRPCMNSSSTIRGTSRGCQVAGRSMGMGNRLLYSRGDSKIQGTSSNIKQVRGRMLDTISRSMIRDMSRAGV